MISVPKVVGVLSCGFLLCLGLSHAAEAHNRTLAADEQNAKQTAPRPGSPETGQTHLHGREGGQSQGQKTIKSDVLRVEGTNCFVQGQEGKEGRLRIDETTPRANHHGRYFLSTREWDHSNPASGNMAIRQEF